MTVQLIADMFDVPQSTVYGYLDRNHLRVPATTQP